MTQKLKLFLLALITFGASTTGNAAGPSEVAAGESCVSSDPNKVCLAMHFVSYLDEQAQPMVSKDQAAKIVGAMNQIWGKCDISFQIGHYEAADPAAKNLPNGVDSQSELDVVRRNFEQPSNELLAVTTADWAGTTNAWTNMPGDPVYGAVMEVSMASYGSGIIYAHEFGHYLGLDHVSDESNLMNPVIAPSATALDASQCESAREVVNSYWSAMLRK